MNKLIKVSSYELVPNLSNEVLIDKVYQRPGTLRLLGMKLQVLTSAAYNGCSVGVFGSWCLPWGLQRGRAASYCWRWVLAARGICLRTRPARTSLPDALSMSGTKNQYKLRTNNKCGILFRKICWEEIKKKQVHEDVNVNFGRGKVLGPYWWNFRKNAWSIIYLAYYYMPTFLST